MEENKENIVLSEASKNEEAEKETSEPVVASESAQKMSKKTVKIKLRTAIIIAVIIVIVVLGYIYKGLFVAATVNGSSISRLSIIQKLEKASGKSLLDSLVADKLVAQAAKAKGISVSNDEISGEIKKIQDQVSAQGGTLDEALASQGMSMDDLKNRILLQKDMEKLLGDKVSVTDQEVDQYIAANKITLPKGQEAATRGQIKSQLGDQKLNTQAQSFIDDLKSKAKIRYFVNY